MTAFNSGVRRVPRIPTKPPNHIRPDFLGDVIGDQLSFVLTPPAYLRVWTIYPAPPN